MDGIELLRTINRNAPNRVIMITATVTWTSPSKLSFEATVRHQAHQRRRAGIALKSAQSASPCAGSFRVHRKS